MSNDMWQKCPVCNGNHNIGAPTCGTCRGSGIISILNGAPPEWAGKTITTSGSIPLTVPQWIIDHNNDPKNH